MNQLITFTDVNTPQATVKSKHWLELSLSVVSKLLENNKASLELNFYLRLVNALRIIALHILEKDELRSKIKDNTWVDSTDLIEYDPRIINCFIDFAEKLGILLRQGEQIRLNPKYSDPLLLNCRFLTERLSSDQNYHLIKERVRKHSYHEELKDFLHIYLLISLKNNQQFSAQMLSEFGLHQHWIDLVTSHSYDMQLEMAEYTFELLDISLFEKIPSPRPENYYTRLGEDAIKNLSQENFIELVENLKVERNINRVLDVGCGYGNYLEIFQKMKGFQKIYGVEMQRNVWEVTTEKFKKDPEVQVINDNIFNVELEQEVDLILLNFVLFYFSVGDKLKLLRKLKQLLSQKGVIVLCQYYSNIESIQNKLAKLKKEFDWEKRIQIYFASIVLYAEVLLNETINVFQASEQWDELLVLLEQAGLRIKYVTNADSFYYSLFVVIEKDPHVTLQDQLRNDNDDQGMSKNEVITLNKQGLAKREQQDLTTAIHCFSQGLKLDPDHKGILYNRGITYYQSQNYMAAIRDFNQLISKLPMSASSYFYRGLAYLNTQRFVKAKQDLETAVNLYQQQGHTINYQMSLASLEKSKQCIVQDTSQSVANKESISPFQSRKVWFVSVICLVGLLNLGIFTSFLRFEQPSPALDSTNHHLVK